MAAAFLSMLDIRCSQVAEISEALWRPELRSAICLTAAAACAGMAGGCLLSGHIDRQNGR